MHTSKWITCPGFRYSETKLYWFRRTLTLPKAPVSAVLHISAEARYKLFINGQRVCFGPCRTSAEEKYYDTVDVAPYLQEGVNEIFCPVLQLTETSDMTAPRHLYAIRRTGNLALAVKLTCSMEGEDDVVLITDESWEVCPSPASTFPIQRGDMIVCTLEETFASAEAKWQKAAVLGRVDCARETPFLYGITNDLFLTPRPIPMLYQNDVTPLTENGTPVLPDEDGYIIMNELTFGFPRFVFTGSGKVTIRYAESFGDGGAKSDRLDRTLGITGSTDVVAVDGETVFEPFWFRTCRIIRIDTEGTVTLRDFRFTETGYPLDVPKDCDFGSETDNALWNISVATLKRCMIESYEDCPFYEQLQYDMDTSMQMIFNYQLTGDDRLARKAIHDFRLSQRADGLMNSRYPSAEIQYIPTFCFYFIFMIAEHYRRFGDKTLVRENLRAMDGVLEWFDGHMDSCGLLHNTMYWDFVDWSAPWMATRGEPYIGGESKIVTIHSAMYVYALREAAKLASLCGRDCVSAEYTGRADRLVSAIEALAWREDRGLYADDLAGNYYSQHMQVWCVLSGIARGEKARRIMENALPLDTKCTQAYGYLYFRALEAAGLYDKTQDMMDNLRALIPLHCTTIPETPDAPRSDCHAWGAVAIYEFAAVVLGVRTLSAADKKVRIQPDITGRDHAKGSVATIGGMISVDWKIEDGWFRMRIAAPRGLNQEIVLPNGAVMHTDLDAAVYTCRI